MAAADGRGEAQEAVAVGDGIGDVYGHYLTLLARIMPKAEHVLTEKPAAAIK